MVPWEAVMMVACWMSVTASSRTAPCPGSWAPAGRLGGAFPARRRYRGRAGPLRAPWPRAARAGHL